MKDHIGEKIAACNTFTEVKAIVDDYMDYYNNERFQWGLCKLAPNEYYAFFTTGVYPLPVKNPPKVPVIQKSSADLGKAAAEKHKQEVQPAASDAQGASVLSRDSTLGAASQAHGQPLT